MGDGEEFDFAALSDNEDDGVSDVVWSDTVLGNFEGGDGGAGAGRGFLDAGAGFLDAGENAGAEETFFPCGDGDVVAE